MPDAGPDRLLHTFRLNVGLPSTARAYDGWEAPAVELRGHPPAPDFDDPGRIHERWNRGNGATPPDQAYCR